MKNALVGLLILIALVAALPVQAQRHGVRVRGTNPNYREGDWISYSVSRFVTSVAVGRQYIYFGTTGGITRWNYFNNQWDYPYTTSNGLASNSITAVALDESTGLLWCGTVAGISYYHPTAEKWTNVYKDEIGIPKFDDVVSIGIADEKILFETRGGRMYEGDKFGEPISERSSISPPIRSQVIWYGERANKRQLPLFFMNDGYFFSRDGGYVQDFRLRRAEISSAVEDPWGYMWLGSWGFGALRGEVRTDQLQVLPFGLYNANIEAIALDKNGLWLGGQNGNVTPSGLTYWDQVRQRWTYFESRFIADLLSDDINRLVVAGDSLFCATRFGISLYDMAHDEWFRITTFDGLGAENINDVLVEGNDIWVATDRGLNHINRRTLGSDSLEVIEIAPKTLRLAKIYDLEKTENLLWVATEFGLFIYNTLTGEGDYLEDVNGPAGQVVTRIARSGNEIWFGTLRSVEAYNFRKGKWLTPPERNLFLPNPVRALAVNKKAVWAGTDAGVLKFNRKTRDWRRFTVEDGLLDNRVNAILIDGDYVWFGTPHGITEFYWNDPSRVD